MEMKLALVGQFVCWGSGQECTDPPPLHGETTDVKLQSAHC